MNKGGAHFTSSELALVLSHYDIGIIQQILPLIAGNRKAPKQIVVSDTGKYLLKRRAKGKDDQFRVAFSHSVQNHLKNKNFPLPKIVHTKTEKSSFLCLDSHIYELFEFVGGTRFDGKTSSIIDCGTVLAKFHLSLKDFPLQEALPRGSFHDSPSVRGNLKKIGSEKNGDGNGNSPRKTAEELMMLYNSSAVAVNQLGYDDWPQQLIHGDWHPGNMLFANGKTAAVLDFDSLKVSSILTDLANGALQFSIVGGRPNPADWPDYLDQSKLVHFLYGYCLLNMLSKNSLYALPFLMLETMIAESVLPIAATGLFVNLEGTDFLKMILRKCLWIHKNTDKLLEAVEHCLADIKTAGS